MAMATTAEELAANGEVVEMWDGELVVKGQPTPGHEAIRACVLYQLGSQLTEGTALVVSSVVGDDHSYVVSDGSILDLGPEGATPVWIEVLSQADFRKDQRQTGRIRRDRIFQHDVASIWMIVEALGVVTLTVIHRDGTEPVSAVSPATITVPVRHAGTDHPITIDLAALAEAARTVADR